MTEFGKTLMTVAIQRDIPTRGLNRAAGISSKAFHDAVHVRNPSVNLAKRACISLGIDGEDMASIMRHASPRNLRGNKTITLRTHNMSDVKKTQMVRLFEAAKAMSDDTLTLAVDKFVLG